MSKDELIAHLDQAVKQLKKKVEWQQKEIERLKQGGCRFNCRRKGENNSSDA